MRLVSIKHHKLSLSTGQTRRDLIFLICTLRATYKSINFFKKEEANLDKVYIWIYWLTYKENHQDRAFSEQSKTRKTKPLFPIMIILRKVYS